MKKDKTWWLDVGSKRKASISYDPRGSGVDDWVASFTTIDKRGGTRKREGEKCIPFRPTDHEAPRATRVKILTGHWHSGERHGCSEQTRGSTARRRQRGHRHQWDHPWEYKVRRKKDPGEGVGKIFLSWIVKERKELAAVVCTDTRMNPRPSPHLKVNRGWCSSLHETSRVEESFRKSNSLCINIISSLNLKVLLRMLSSSPLMRQHLVQCFRPNLRTEGSQLPGGMSILWVCQDWAKIIV